MLSINASPHKSMLSCPVLASSSPAPISHIRRHVCHRHELAAHVLALQQFEEVAWTEGLMQMDRGRWEVFYTTMF